MRLRARLSKIGLVGAGAVAALLLQQALAVEQHGKKAKTEKNAPIETGAAPLAVASVTCAISGSAIANANNSRAMTISDTDLQHVLDWVKVVYLQIIADKFNGGVATGFNPTVPQIEWGWFQATVVNSSTLAEQQFRITPPEVPPPISIQ